MYISPQDVISPKTSWRLVDVIIDDGPDACAYAIGMWNKKRRIGFRWNGNDESPLGTPQSRGLPIWTILDPRLYNAISRLVTEEKAPIMRAFFGKKFEPNDLSVPEAATRPI